MNSPGDPTLLRWAAVLAAPAANDVTPTRLDVLAARTGLRRVSIDGVEVLMWPGSDAPVRFRR